MEPDSGPAWIQNRDGNGNNICVCVCVADRAGEPAGSVGSGPVGVPQPLCRNPPTALQQDGGQVLIRWLGCDKNNPADIDQCGYTNFFLLTVQDKRSVQ